MMNYSPIPTYVDEPPHYGRRGKLIRAGLLGAALFGSYFAWSNKSVPAASTQLAANMNRIRMEPGASVPSAWEKGTRADKSQTLSLRLALKHREDLDLEKELLHVSTPGSSRYGKHMSLAEINQLVAPHASTLEEVHAWLERYGLEGTNITKGSDFLSVELTIGQAEELLMTEYHQFQNANGKVVSRTESYSVPEKISKILDFVAPTVQFPGVQAAAHKISRVKDEENLPWMQESYSYIYPSELQSMYSIDADAVGGGDNNNSQAITAFLDEEYCASDLQTFYKKFSTSQEGFTLSEEYGSTTDDDPGCGDEANLDVQYITAMGSKVPTKFWSFAGNSPDIPKINEPFLDFMLYLNSKEYPPWVVSTSYGEDEGSTSHEYAVRVQAEFMKAGLRGISLFFASGDSGVASMFSMGKCDHFSPQWPAASPWVTSVGATSGVTTETAADFSSGGFSYRWAMPEYQRTAVLEFLKTEKDTVEGYVNQELLPSTMYTANGTGAGRGFPDVSAAGSNFLIVLDGNVYTVDGTSAATPVFAGIISLVNEKRAAKGKNPLGFLNPLIYNYGADIFNDITSGTNPGCDTTGFTAVSGWDPVTGMGTPDYQKIVDVALKLP